MNSDLVQAKSLIKSGAYTCVLCKNSHVLTTEKTGILPLVEWIDSGTDLQGFSAADKIVGRAAAFLYILMGVKAVYAPVMSGKAMILLTQNGIQADCDTQVTAIINRKGTGICPMEQAVRDVEEPLPGFLAIKKALENFSA